MGAEEQSNDVSKALEANKDVLVGAGLMSKDSVIRGFYFKDLNVQVAIAFNEKTGKIELAAFKGADGTLSVYKFDDIKQDAEGNVTLAKGRIYKLENGKLTDTKMRFEYAAKGTKEFNAAMAEVKSLVTNEAVLAKLDQANRVYT
jgi:hypothetical protein